MNCAEANQVDLVDYLNSLGYQSAKVRGNDYWFLSPFRTESDPSFKINRKQNVWYDHGEGKGGSMLDFVIQFHHCDIPGAIEKIQAFRPKITLQKLKVRPRFHLHKQSKKGHTDAKESGIKIIAAKPLDDLALCRYLHKRKIQLSIAKQYTEEVHFKMPSKEKTYRAIGFKNDEGGYELRNEYFKGSSSPKAITYLNNGVKSLSVFEGFFDMLSYFSMHHFQDIPRSNLLVLNSLSFFEKHLDLMAKAHIISLYFDHDHAGRKYTEMGLSRSVNFIDASNLYKGYKDLNDWLMNFGKLIQKYERGQPLKSHLKR